MRKELDLKMLYFFRAIYQSGNVSQASEMLELSQPSGSLLLKRLREEFNDALFVRVGQKMVPTAGAQHVSATIFSILDLVDNQLDITLPFDPHTSRRSFTIAMTDISQMTLMPRLLEAFKQAGADKVQLSIREIDDTIYPLLESGEVSLAIGYLMDIPDNFYQQRLFDEHYICLSSAQHPRIQQPPTQEEWIQEQHLMVRGDGTGHADTDRHLARYGIHERISMVVPNFLGVGGIVANSELLATVPCQVAESFISSGSCQAWPLPVAFPSFTIRQVWHQRYHNDPGIIWLRQQLAKLSQAD